MLRTYVYNPPVLVLKLAINYNSLFVKFQKSCKIVFSFTEIPVFRAQILEHHAILYQMPLKYQEKLQNIEISTLTERSWLIQSHLLKYIYPKKRLLFCIPIIKTRRLTLFFFLFLKIKITKCFTFRQSKVSPAFPANSCFGKLNQNSIISFKNGMF